MKKAVERIQPGPGQESVWDYPRPLCLEDTNAHIQIFFNGKTIVDSFRAKRVLETSHPPNYYIPPSDIRMDYLKKEEGYSFCEWKGRAPYLTLEVDGKKTVKAAWYYPEPSPPFQPIKNFIAFYAGRVDACYVNGEKVRPQPGNFYGGWITSRVVGPFKGEF